MVWMMSLLPCILFFLLSDNPSVISFILCISSSVPHFSLSKLANSIVLFDIEIDFVNLCVSRV